MERIVKVLESWTSSRCEKIELAALYARNPTAHKWKATYRSIVLRELILWRVTDLWNQMVFLVEAEHLLGARILLRSSIETIAVLIYLNQKTNAILEGRETFKSFEKTTTRLIVGSKNDATEIEAINVNTVLEKWCEKKYPGISELYAHLCESAHPNYEGLCNGYSYVDEENYVTTFENRWKEIYGDNIVDQTLMLMEMFDDEYRNVWTKSFDELEKWIQKNDEKLEAERNN